MGRTAAGKSALADALAEQGMLVVGRKRSKENNDLVLQNDNDAEAMTISPEKLEELCQNNPDAKYHLIYIIAAENAARLTMAKLAFSVEDDEADDKVKQQEDAESETFNDIESRIQKSADEGTFLFPPQIGSVRVFVNDYQTTSLAQSCAKIILEERLRKNVQKIINDCAFTFSDIRTDDNGNIITEASDGTPTPQKPIDVVDSYMARPEAFGPVMMAWLKHVDLTKMEDVPKYTDDIILEK